MILYNYISPVLVYTFLAVDGQQNPQVEYSPENKIKNCKQQQSRFEKLVSVRKLFIAHKMI